MVTVTSLSQFVFHSLGPLTTTYTAPASCSTNIGSVAIAKLPSPILYFGPADCETKTRGDCYPSGAAMDAYNSSNPDYLLDFTVDYFSPGIHCPAGWATFGVATKDAQGTITPSGAFAREPISTNRTGSEPFFIQGPNALLAAIEPGETAVLCCPSHFTTNEKGGCYSHLPAYTVTARCLAVLPDDNIGTIYTTFSYYGQTLTGGLLTVTGTFPTTVTLRDTIEPSNAASMVGLTTMPMVTLVHKEADLQLSNTQSRTATSSSSAATGRRVVPAGKSVAVIMLAWFVVSAVGVVLFLPL